MWVEPDELMDADDAVVFTRLAGALRADCAAAEPSAAELDDLRLMVAARFGPSVPAPAPQSVSRTRASRRRARKVGALAVLFLAGSASAAAAGDGLPLPAPVRAAAYAIGLPVDSPALDNTHRHIRSLERAVATRDVDEARAAILRLERSLIDVPEEERERAESEVGTALVSARPLLHEALADTGDDRSVERKASPGPPVPQHGETEAGPATTAAQSSPPPAAPTSSPVEPEPEPEPAPGSDPGVADQAPAPEPALPSEDDPSQDASNDGTSPGEAAPGEDDAMTPTPDDPITDAGSPMVSEPAPAPDPYDEAAETDRADH